MNNVPLITIVTPSYNQGQFIEATILSVLNQSYKNIQYVIIDGGSTDNTMEIVNKYKDRIDIIVHERDKGQADAINKGFKLAKGELVGWINSDDVLLKDAVSKVVSLYLEHSDTSVIMASKLNWIDENGAIIKKVEIPSRSADDLIFNNYNIIQQGSFYKTENVVKVGFCNVDLHYCMDLDLILKLLKHGKIYFIDEVISEFRIYGITKTSTGGNKFLKEIKKTLKQYGLKTNSYNYYRIHKELLKNSIKNVVKIH